MKAMLHVDERQWCYSSAIQVMFNAIRSRIFMSSMVFSLICTIILRWMYDGSRYTLKIIVMSSAIRWFAKHNHSRCLSRAILYANCCCLSIMYLHLLHCDFTGHFAE
ncbi:hypothetical protein Tcan_00190 [Toxocara canis]|uniref:Uncharacterized protein n=1 Tax=Toxocara canis TaxID=6265 RepID=A0A0B2UXK6_TOXCA|nr:hypothetical protein Tcan_00190 [Toxocara canis]